ncbi:MAG: hypothetical protein CMB99_05840 [Flavobacteriaceae bacterium]|nr:hypothetical protein [Flavobacteriaceae bacterium]|tara:strand:+ start:14882 stop:15949 length:1068 start_codon:yes stop_codon:yes gene_type:complete
MKTKLITLSLLFFCSLSFNAQSGNQKKDLDQNGNERIYRKKVATKYNLNDEKDVNALRREFWIANRSPSYVSVPYVTPIKDRRIPTMQGEGTSNLQLLEAFINLSFPLYWGKEIHTRLLALEYTANFRMTLDDSKPLTPGSNHIGLSYYQNLGYKKISDNKIDFTSARVQLKHYSNGQDPGFFFVDPNNPTNFRNDYRSGDFSTNYLWFQFTRGRFNKSLGSLHQITAGWRFDLGTESSTFAYTQEQIGSYGRNRFSFSYDYRTKRFNKNYEHHFRVDSEYIVGDLSNFSPNIANDNGKYRFNIRTMYEFAPKSHYAVGYFISAYYGRDYLNIRYDDIIFSLQAGITLSLEKFNL